MLRHLAEEEQQKNVQLANEKEEFVEENKHLWNQLQDYQQDQQLMDRRIQDNIVRMQEFDRRERLAAEREASLRVKEATLEDLLHQEREATESMRTIRERERHHGVELAERTATDAAAMSARHRSDVGAMQAKLDEAVRANHQWERKLVDVQGRLDAATLESERSAAASGERARADAAELKVEELRELLHAAEVECRKVKADLRPLKQFRDRFGEGMVIPGSATDDTGLPADMARTRQQVEFLKISSEHTMNQLTEAEIKCSELDKQVNAREITIERLRIEYQALEKQAKAAELRAIRAEKQCGNIEQACAQSRSVVASSSSSAMFFDAPSPVVPGQDTNTCAPINAQETEVHSLQSVNALLRRQLDAVRKENVQLRIDRCNMVPIAIAGTATDRQSRRNNAWKDHDPDPSEVAWRQRIADLRVAVSPHLGDPEEDDAVSAISAQVGPTPVSFVSDRSSSPSQDLSRSPRSAGAKRVSISSHREELSPERTSPDMARRVAERVAERDQKRVVNNERNNLSGVTCIRGMRERGVNKERFAFDYKPPPPRQPPPVFRPQSAQVNASRCERSRY